MKSKTIEILNKKALFDVRERNMDILTDYYRSCPSLPLGLMGISACRNVEIAALNTEMIDGIFDELAERAHFSEDYRILRPLSIDMQLYGVHFIDKLFGAEIHYNKNQNLWWSEGVKNPIGTLEFPDFKNSELWQRCVWFYEEIINRNINLPFLATQILGSPTVGIFNLYKENVLYGFYDDPEGVRHDLRVLTDTLIYLHKWFLMKIPKEIFQPICIDGRLQPRGCGQLCGCTTQLISNEIYEEFLFPLDKEIFSLYENGGLYHLCGAHTQHIKTWQSWKELKAVQLNDRASDDFEEYFTKLRDDQIIYLTPNETMTIERALEISGGKRTILVGEPNSISKHIGCYCKGH